MDRNEIENIEKLENLYWWFLARRELVVSLLKRCVPKDKRLEILDLGCGTGKLMEDLSKFGKIIGIDISPYAIEVCHKKGLKEIYQEDIVSMHFSSESFDLITALDVFEHIEDDRKAFREVFRILRNKGIFLLTVPANRSLWSYRDISLNHKRRYTISELRNRLTSAGFKIEKIGYCVSLLFLPIFIFYSIQRIYLWLFPLKTLSVILILPKFINGFLLLISKLENLLIKNGFYFPFGVSIFCIAIKEG